MIVDFEEGALTSVKPLYVPLFQPMQVIKGDLESIEEQLKSFANLADEPLPTWLSIEVETQDYLNDLQQRVQVLTEGMNVEILQLRRAKKQQQKRIEGDNKEVLAELSPMDVFERRLALEEFITDDDQQRLKRLRQQFEKTVAEVEQELSNED